MKELEFDSDQTDYEEEKTDDEGEGGEEPELGKGARDWLVDERKERESTEQNTESYERAVKRLKDIETAKVQYTLDCAAVCTLECPVFWLSVSRLFS